MQALYAEDISRSDPHQLLNTIIKPEFNDDKANFEFAEKLFYWTINHQEQLDEIIREHTTHWRIDRLAHIDKVILRAALCEFIYFPEIPTKVTINEAIEIAKKYSTAKSGNFINGILDAALEHLQEQDQIHKKGRGRIESSINR
jgi:N utilization substance protein B